MFKTDYSDITHPIAFVLVVAIVIGSLCYSSHLNHQVEIEAVKAGLQQDTITGRWIKKD